VVPRVGRFSRPPALEDVARLELDQGDVDDLRECKPGRCDLQVGAGLAQLRAAIDWRRPDHAQQVNACVRQRLIDYVRAYSEQGDAALVTYDDASKPVSLAGQWRALLAGAPCFQDYAPALARYLAEYPRAPRPGASDFIQWSALSGVAAHPPRAMVMATRTLPRTTMPSPVPHG
jgi:hypothetical protein